MIGVGASDAHNVVGSAKYGYGPLSARDEVGRPVRTGIGKCALRQTVAQSNCHGLSGFHASTTYPFRSPLVVSDYISDALGVTASEDGHGRTLALGGSADRDLRACLHLRPDLRGQLTVGRMQGMASMLSVRRQGGMAKSVEIGDRSLALSHIGSALTNTSAKPVVADAWYWTDARARAVFLQRGGRTNPVAEDDVAPSVMIVRALSRLVNARGLERGTAFIGLDGYSVPDMDHLPQLLQKLNSSGAHVQLRRLPFDESPDRFTGEADGAPLTSHDRLPLRPPPVLGLLSHHLGSNANGPWRRWGIWHIIQCELGRKPP